MSSLPLPRSTTSRPTPHWRTLLGFVALTALACILVAALLTLAVPSTGGFGRNLLISECIGLSILAWVMLLRRLPAFRHLGHTSAIVAVTAAGMPLGYLSGYSLAYALLGEPLRLVTMGPGRLVAIVTTLLATGFVGYFLWMRSRIAVEAAARSEAQRLAAESQLRLLRAQLEPHMLFNTLANLRSLVEEDPKLAQRMIDQLNTYLRSALAASRTESTALRQEFAQLKAYLEIMALRMGTRLSYELDLPEPLQQVAVPPMLLQPLVENAIKHGLEPKIGGGRMAALEILVATESVRSIIRENKTVQLLSVMQTGKKYGMQTLEDHLGQLVSAKLITIENAIARANSPDAIRTTTAPHP